MAKTNPWHSRLEEGKPDGVYHDDTKCTTGNNIESYNRVEGTGGLRHCKDCRDLQS